MKYSTQSTNLSSMAAYGSTFITGTGTFTNTNQWSSFRTVDANTVIADISGHSSIDGLSYITGKTLTAPYEFLGAFSSIRLTTGALQAFK